METILSGTMRRRFYILHRLHTTNGWTTLEQLMQYVEATRTTILNDLDYLRSHWSNILTIEHQENRGVRLITNHEYSIHDIYRTILQESKAFRLLEAIFFNPNGSREYWQNEFYVSESTLYRISQRLNQNLEERGMRLNRAPYQVVGKNERQIRIFFKRYFWEAYGVHGWPFKISRERLFEFIEKLNIDFGWQHENRDRVDMAFAMAITFNRGRQGCMITDDPNKTEEHQELIAVMERYREDIVDIIKPLNMELPQYWKEDFVYSIFWWEFAWDNNQEAMRYFELGYEFIDTIQGALDLEMDYESRQRIHDSFIKHYMQYKIFPYPQFIFYDRSWFGSELLQKQLRVFSLVVAKALRDLERKLNIPWYTVHFNSLLVAIASYWKNLSIHFDELKRKAKIVVLSDLGTYHVAFLGSYLQSLFGNKVDITIPEESWGVPDQWPMPEADIYIANFSAKNLPPGKLYVVEDIPSYKNLVEIQQEIEKFRIVSEKDIPYLTN